MKFFIWYSLAMFVDNIDTFVCEDKVPHVTNGKNEHWSFTKFIDNTNTRLLLACLKNEKYLYTALKKSFILQDVWLITVAFIKLSNYKNGHVFFFIESYSLFRFLVCFYRIQIKL